MFWWVKMQGKKFVKAIKKRANTKSVYRPTNVADRKIFPPCVITKCSRIHILVGSVKRPFLRNKPRLDDKHPLLHCIHVYHHHTMYGYINGYIQLL